MNKALLCMTILMTFIMEMGKNNHHVSTKNNQLRHVLHGGG